MKTWLKISLGLLVWGGALGSGCSGALTNQPVTTAAAIQAIQQAPDPSAAVAAYGSGLAIAPNDPKLHEAYVARMVDMGLPEMAFHQAETLTTLQPNNGLAWGVVAYVNARRGQMPEAVSAINLAGQFASNNKFVAHTAGEILAWYDLKADKTKMPENAKDGVARIRGLLDKQPAFTEAYDTARKAYQTQSSAAQPAGPEAPAQDASAAQAPEVSATSPISPGAYAPQAVAAPQTLAPADQGAPLTYLSPPAEPDYTPVYYPPYYDWAPDYCYDWGPGWCAPSPWCWWSPCGFWGGCGFFPFGVTLAFGGFDDFHHGHHDGGFDHGHGFGHGGDSGHGGNFGHGGNNGHGGNFGSGGTFASAGGFGNRNNPAMWHNGSHGSSSYFGTPARPSASLAQFNTQGSAGRSSSTFASTSTHWWAGRGSGWHDGFAHCLGAARHCLCPEWRPRLAGDLGCWFCDGGALRRLFSGARRSGSCYPCLERGLGGLPGWAGGATLLFGPRLPYPVLLGAAIRRAGRPLLRQLPFSSILRRRLGQDGSVLLGAAFLRWRVQRRLSQQRLWRWRLPGRRLWRRWRLPRRRVWWWRWLPRRRV